ncbi:MAG: hypothetical protein ACPIOQ_67370, partial [Promethearchaeia archaeon]
MAGKNISARQEVEPAGPKTASQDSCQDSKTEQSAQAERRGWVARRLCGRLPPQRCLARASPGRMASAETVGRDDGAARRPLKG